MLAGPDHARVNNLQMSLRHALIGLLAAEPASGYELTRRFAESMAYVWPAGHGQIYPELARLADDGLIEQIGKGPRGRRTYSATTQGVAALRLWLRSTEPDYGCRSDADLRDFFLWAVPTAEAIQHLERDAQEHRRRREQVGALSTTVDRAVNTQTRMQRLALEKGLRYYTIQIEWAAWATAEIKRDGHITGDDQKPWPPSSH